MPLNGSGEPTWAHFTLASMSAAWVGRGAFAGKLMPTPWPPGPKLGSGKAGIPCARMQRAFASKRFCCASVIGGGGLPCGRRRAHVASADWYAGDSGLMLDGKLTLPFAFRSGKFRTPCPRIQSEYLTPPAEVPRSTELLGFAEDPHAATAIVQPITTSTSLRRRGMCMLS